MLSFIISTICVCITASPNSEREGAPTFVRGSMDDWSGNDLRYLRARLVNGGGSSSLSLVQERHLSDEANEYSGPCSGP